MLREYSQSSHLKEAWKAKKSKTQFYSAINFQIQVACIMWLVKMNTYFLFSLKFLLTNDRGTV
jgi:hypothetical protein